MTSGRNLVAYPEKGQGLGEQVAKPSAGFCYSYKEGIDP
jgi:hypothetical protein